MKKKLQSRSSLLGLFAAGASFTAWFSIPAQTWGGRSWAVGSSVCHQIPSHSIRIGGVQFPICARCAGLYLGNFIGLILFAVRGKKKGLPRRFILVLLLVFMLAWVGDGVNSFVSDLLNRPFLYETSNLSRLVTGFGMGLVMSTALATLFNMVIWQEAESQPLLHSGGMMALYAGLSGLTGGGLWFASPLLFRALSFLSVATILAVISLLYTVFWVIVLKKENQFTNWGTLAPYLIAGLATALAQIMLLNLIRQQVLG